MLGGTENVNDAWEVEQWYRVGSKMSVSSARTETKFFFFPWRLLQLSSHSYKSLAKDPFLIAPSCRWLACCEHLE